MTKAAVGYSSSSGDGEFKNFILVADDDLVFSGVVKRILGLAGYHVDVVSNGCDAIAQAQRRDYNLVLLDIEMPDISGFEVARKLHQLPIVFLSAHHDEEYIEKAVNSNDFSWHVIGYFPKAMDISMLPNLVRAALGIANHNRDRQKLLESVAQGLEDERRSIAKELHDEYGQQLNAIRKHASLIYSLSSPERIGDIADAIKRIHDYSSYVVDATISIQKGIRALYDRLWPESIEEMGLAHGIQDQVASFGLMNPSITLDSNIDIDGVDQYGPHVIVIYRILQEALTNVARHTNATKVNVKVFVDKSRLCVCDSGESIFISVVDNGQGFTLDDKLTEEAKKVDVERRRKYGLLGMRERANSLGGYFDVNSKTGDGTKIEVEIPLRSTVTKN